MTLVESMVSGKIKISWLSDEDIEKMNRVSKGITVCYFTSNLLNSFFSGINDNTTRARDHQEMM